MAKAAPPKKRELSRRQTRLKVMATYDSDDSSDALIDHSHKLHPTRIELTSGGSRVGAISCDYDLGKNDQRIVDTLAPKRVDRQIEIHEVESDGETKRVIAWGKLASQPVSIGETETMQLVARLDKHVFGIPLGRTPFWQPADSGSVIELDRPLVFNQEVDEKILSNRSDKEWASHGNAYVFFDSMAINTLAARDKHDQTPAKWRIYEAVHTLCWMLNSEETYIKNPTRADCYIDLYEIDQSNEVLRNVSIKPGVYLPQALDQLLTPFGASWTVDFTYDKETKVTTRKIRLFRRNHGTKRELFLQRPGEKLVVTKSNVPALSINYDIANLANKIVGLSSRKQREGTWPLFPLWRTSQDDLDRDDLEKDVDGLQQSFPHAFRKFGLNESGAFTDLRPGITFTDLTSHFDGDPTLPTCRRFLPCLSRTVEGDSDVLESRGIWVEWLNPETEAWEKVTWSHSNLEQQCGIWFESIPEKLYDAIQADPTTLRIRVTATIEGDRCLAVTADGTETSPNADPIELRLDLSDKFHDKQVKSSSIFYADRATSDSIDSTAALTAYVNRILEVENSAELSCSATLEGIDHPEYQIGDLITSVNGRNLKLNRNNVAPGGVEKYLQIMGITYNLPSGPDSKPQTELLLESFDEESL